jgi:hypothetical protein
MLSDMQKSIEVHVNSAVENTNSPASGATAHAAVGGGDSLRNSQSSSNLSGHVKKRESGSN